MSFCRYRGLQLSHLFGTRLFSMGLFCSVAVAFLLSNPNITCAQYNPLELITTPNVETQTDGDSNRPGVSFSATGRHVVFDSVATNLVLNDDNGVRDVFIFDRAAAEGSRVTRVSLDSTEQEGDGTSLNPSVSADGRYVVFESDATNLIDTDTNEARDIFLRDTVAGTTIRISVDSDGIESNGSSMNARISSDGAFIVFESDASNLVLNDTNGLTDIFLYNRSTEAVSRLSVDSDEIESNGAASNPSINSDGSLVAFDSVATNLVTSDTNGASDVFLRNITSGTTSILSADRDGSHSNGDSSNPFLSEDGTLVSFTSSASDLVLNDDNGAPDVFLVTIATNSKIRVSESQLDDGSASHSSISGDNAFVFFQSDASDLVLNDDNQTVDIFAYETSTGSVTRLSVDEFGIEIGSGAAFASSNSNGQYVAYTSADEDFFTNDNNEQTDIFLVDTQCLLTPTGVTPQDQDSDGTDDCSDACPTDATKTSAGTCGCGTAETDTDGDGTANCNDSCPTDAAKTLVGVCGCGVPDADANGNGVTDCLEFSSSTTPRTPTVIYRNKNQRLKVVIPTDIQGFTYFIQVKSGNTVVRKKRTANSATNISVRGLQGVLQVRYRVLLSSGKTRFSKARRVRVG